MICVGGDTVQVGRVCRLTLIGEEAEVLEDVVLCVSSDPRSYLCVYRPHHAVFGLLDGDVKSLGLAIACH